jgi:HEAT repeat protein
MLEANPGTIVSASLRNAAVVGAAMANNPPRLAMAKWPPDDDAAAPPPAGGTSSGSPDPGDGDFKKGRFGTVAIIVAIAAVVAFAVFLFVGMKQEEQKLTVEQAEVEKKAIYVLPKDEQLPRWQQWAGSEQSDYLREEALKQLAWARDPAGVDLAIKALQSLSVSVRGMAASVLAEYGLPMAAPAKDALLAALAKAEAGTKPQVAWALVVLKDQRALEPVMALYRAGHLSTVKRLDGGTAFDPNRLVDLVSLEGLAGLAEDESPAVRQLVATVLSRNAEAKWTDVLIKLLGDTDGEVARQAAPGLGKIADERARGPLLTALRGSDKESRKKYLEALRDGVGAKGLVLALSSVDEDVKLGWYQTKQIFDMLDALSDMRGGDELNGYLATKPHIHWQTRSATLMAKIGDVRAVSTLAKRLRMDPLKIYTDQYDWEQLLKRDDQERVVAARMIADLAVIHPDKVAQIREQAEDAVIFWIHEMPSPHANGLRALAAMESKKDIEAFRKWANPNVPLPKEGQQPPMPEEWVIAQSAMRYVGWLKDDKSRQWLEKALTARPTELDVTMDGLMQGGVAILGMALRAVGVGAAHGLSQWRDPKAFKPLLAYVEDTKNNEQSRAEACAALAWVATRDDILTVAKKIQEYSGLEKPDQFRRACLLEALIQRPVPGTAAALMELMTPESAIETRHQVARAIARGGFDKDIEAKLFEMLKDEALMNDAALVLILGGAPDVAARAVATYGDKGKEAIRDLADLWYRSFGYWSYEDLEGGLIFKWVDNATAMSRIVIHQAPQEWAKAMLMRQFDNLDFDNGPHSFTRVVLRSRLWEMARGDDKAKRDGAIRTLKFMGEQGVLLALRDEQGEVGEIARAAYFELMNPKVLETGVVKMPDEDDKGSKL